MERTITLKQKGYRVEGEVELNLWGGGTGSIDMQPTDIDELTTENVIRSINDNGFGCESFAGAEVDIYVLYEGGMKTYLTSYAFEEKDLVGCTRMGTDFKKLAEDYERSTGLVIEDKAVV